MEYLKNFFFDNFVVYIESLFAEGYIVLFIAGVLALSLGLLFIAGTLIPIILGPPSIKGTVAGAVRPDIITTSVENKVTIRKGSLFPVFHYIKDDGTFALVRGDSGGTHVRKYKTGQDVNLIINKDTKFIESGTATDKNDMTGVYWGGSFLIIGVSLIYLAWSVLLGLSLGFIALMSIVISLIFRQKKKVKKPKEETEEFFDFSKMKPVEEFK